MPEPDDLEERLADMADRRVAGAERPAPLSALSHRRIRRGERIATGLATLVVVGLVAGGVALARSGQEQATTVRVGPPSGTAACYPSGIPRALADAVRDLARSGTAVAGATPRAMVVANPAAIAPSVTITDPGRTAWEVVVSGEHFVPEFTPPGYADPIPHLANSESWDLDRSLLDFGSAIPGPSAADIAALHPLEVSLSPSCEPTTATTTNTTDPRFAPVSSTIPPATTSPTDPARTGGTPPACVGSQVSLTATTDKWTYAAGDTVTVTVTLLNNGSTCENTSAVDLIDSCLEFEVFDASGKVIYRPPLVCPQPLTIAPVGAGYHRSVTFTWPEPCGSSTCATDICPDAACDTHVPAGAYTVTPANPVFDGLHVASKAIRIT